MRCIAVLVLSCVLTSCAPWSVIGPHSHVLSGADIREIQVVVSKRPDIPHIIVWIQPNCPTEVYVGTCGILPNKGSTYFRMLKRHGGWTIDEASIEVERIITTA